MSDSTQVFAVPEVKAEDTGFREAGVYLKAHMTLK